MKRAVFIGRWTPFHKGHLAIMKKKIDQGIPLLILIRNTHYDIYPPGLRKRMIEAAMSKLKVDAKVMIIDDIESVNYGRGVGYEINQIEVPDDIQKISATEIRSMIERKDDSWREFIPEGADKVLHDYLSGSGIVVWFTGIPKAGKSEIANKVSYMLEREGIRHEVINSKMLRSTISKELGYSKEDRLRNIERAMHVAKLLARQGGIVLASFITPYAKQREMIKKELEEHGMFVEVYVKSSLENAKQRDREELYKRAERGEIPDFTGVSHPYEEPENPHLILNTDINSFDECAAKVYDYIKALM